MTIQIDLTGRRALVTGAASGIGLEAASLLAQAGASVCVADVDEPSAAKAARQIQAQGGRAIGAALDVRDADAAAWVIAAAVDALGGLDILVNNAAVWTVKPFDEQTPADIDRDLGIGLTGTMIVSRAAIHHLTDHGWGRIVNVASDAGRIGEPWLAPYSAAKAGVIGFTKALAKELGRFGVTVNAVSPGTTKTPGAQAIIEQWGGEEKLAKSYPLGRLGEPADIANAILFFCSDLAGWITGQVLSVSGGYTTAG